MKITILYNLFRGHIVYSIALDVSEALNIYVDIQWVKSYFLKLIFCFSCK